MQNYIKVSSILTSEGNITDITFSNEKILLEALSKSETLNVMNTYQYGKGVYQSTLPRSIVFTEIKKYLSSKFGEENYRILYDQTLTWN